MSRRALVTGGNRGIGRAIAAGLVAQGMDVTIAVRDLAGGRKVAAEIGAQAMQLDLQNIDAIPARLAQFGPVDVLVNNAGVLWDEPLFADTAHFATSLDIMVTAPFLLIRAFAPGMESRGYGRIVNISSDWGSFSEGLGGGGAYAIAKAALNALTVRAAQELPDCIKVNSMCPGWVKTRMGGEGATREPAEAADCALWLATLPKDGPTGGFFRDRQRMGW